MFAKYVRAIPFYFVVFLVLVLVLLGIVASSMLGPPPIARQPDVTSAAPILSNNAEAPNFNGDIVAGGNDSTRQATPLEQNRQELRRLLTQIGDHLHSIELGVDAFTMTLESLHDNDAGKRIVTSNEHFPQLAALIKYAPELSASLSKFGTRYSALVAKELASSSETALNSVKLSLSDFDNELAAIEQDVENANLALKAINVVCQKLPAATLTVRAKLLDDEEKEKLRYAQQLKDSQDAAQKEQEKKLQLAEKQRSDAKADLDIATKRLEALKLKQQSVHAGAGISNIESHGRSAQERAELERDYQRDITEINRLLAPLLAQGYSQPEHAGFQRRAREKGPMSLGALRSCGALAPTDSGLQNLGFAMTYANDRGNFGFPGYIGGALRDEHYQYLVPAQKLLLKYQYLLVEKKRLAE